MANFEFDNDATKNNALYFFDQLDSKNPNNLDTGIKAVKEINPELTDQEAKYMYESYIYANIGMTVETGNKYAMFGMAMTGLRLQMSQMLRTFSASTSKVNPTHDDYPDEIIGTKIKRSGKTWGTSKDLVNSATTPGKGCVTPVGRAFQKHAGNSSRAGIFTGEVTGNAAKNTEQGMKYVNEILSNPNSTYTINKTSAFGDVLDVRLPDGTGARWSADGKSFIGFLEKRNVIIK